MRETPPASDTIRLRKSRLAGDASGHRSAIGTADGRQHDLNWRSARVDDMRHSAAKDRTFKTVRLNQGTATQTVPIPRRPLL
jgi:hypothetical protein